MNDQNTVNEYKLIYFQIFAERAIDALPFFILAGEIN